MSSLLVEDALEKTSEFEDNTLNAIISSKDNNVYNTMQSETISTTVAS